MTPERWQQVNELFHSALKYDPAQRGSYLNQVCNGDQELRQEVESLIASHNNSDHFIGAFPIEAATRLIAEDRSDLSIGQRIGQYKILSLLGKGGMGEVYLASDSKLGRKVALKLLPSSFTQDRDRARRFEQEARAASALNHPNILTIFDIEKVEGTHFIATEYIEGQTLRQQLEERKMGLSEALEVAIQVASALSAAHKAGIVHRDIKPENLMLRPDGYVKVLDFGLAKLAERQALSSDTDSTAFPGVQTDSGVLMGTAHYMSPEQARGLSIDHRTDIFSLGVVLYEMVTGHVPFAGQTPSHVIVAILEKEPAPLANYHLEAPAQLQRIINKALSKSREERYSTVEDFLIDLKQLRHEVESGARLERAKDPERLNSGHLVDRWEITQKRLIWLAAFVVMIGIGGGVWLWFPWSALKPTLPPMNVVEFTNFQNGSGVPAFSPDGNQIAFVWAGEKNENRHIYTKMIDGGNPLQLTKGPATDISPAWSPDGRRIAFVRISDKLEIFTASALGGEERRLITLDERPEAGYATNVSWSPDGKVIAFSDKPSALEPRSIFLLSLESLEKQRLTTPPEQYWGDIYTEFSPDGKSLTVNRFSTTVSSDLYVVPVAGGETRRLTFDNANITGAAWSEDGKEIVFASNRLGSIASLWKIAASGGSPERIAITGENSAGVVIARRGHRMAYGQCYNPNTNIHRIELQDSAIGADRPILAAGRKNPSTCLLCSSRHDMDAKISPDGNRIVFQSDRSATMEIWVCNSDGSNPRQVTSFGGPSSGSPNWSPDGRQIAFDSVAKGDTDIYVIDAEGGKPRRISDETSDEVVPTWSHDGRWIYFGSNRNGGWQVWKIPTEGGKAVQVTRYGGLCTAESPDGKSVYYSKFGSPGIYQVPVDGGDETLVIASNARRNWAVADDGIYFITQDTGGEAAIECFNLATRRVRNVAALGKINLWLMALAVSPDRRWFLYTQVDPSNTGNITMVENFR
ncbi:MAG TPA: protein kinase [Blastocatellia bacterium]|nr:protein kinase [Blastocatellia bacterium]